MDGWTGGLVELGVGAIPLILPLPSPSHINSIGSDPSVELQASAVSNSSDTHLYCYCFRLLPHIGLEAVAPVVTPHLQQNTFAASP